MGPELGARPPFAGVAIPHSRNLGSAGAPFRSSPKAHTASGAASARPALASQSPDAGGRCVRAADLEQLLTGESLNADEYVNAHFVSVPPTAIGGVSSASAILGPLTASATPGGNKT